MPHFTRWRERCYATGLLQEPEGGLLLGGRDGMFTVNTQRGGQAFFGLGCVLVDVLVHCVLQMVKI